MATISHDHIRRHFPFLVTPLRLIYMELFTYRMSRMSMSQRFNYIKKYNLWGDIHSVSGSGSTLEQTTKIRNDLPQVIKDLNIESMLDIPCGDYFWMRHVNFDFSLLKSYVGADIVEDLIFDNLKYANQNISFRCINLVLDNIPTVDLIFCRDCLVHLSLIDIFKAITNIRDSRSRYLVTTTYSCTDRINEDIITGDWRPINLQSPPFGFPPPVILIDEQCTEKGSSDKCLGVWNISDIP
jgi:hypothetical protein